MGTRSKMSTDKSRNRQDSVYGLTLSWPDMAVSEARDILAAAEPGVRYTIGKDAPIWAESALAESIAAFVQS